MRRISALVSSVALSALLAATLAGCSGSAADSCEPTVAPGDASEIVTAPGEVGTAPKVDFPTPLVSPDAQRTVLVEGDGDPAPTGGTVDFEATVVNGETGALIVATAYSGSSDNPPVRGVAGRNGALYASLVCAAVGDRIVITTPSGDAGIDLTQAGIPDPATPVVFVVDVIATYLGKANGVNQLPQDGMPTVVTAPDGTPGITVPSDTPPSTTRSSTIKAGNGATVAEGDRVVVNFSTWIWPTDGGDLSVLATTWGKAPTTYIATSDPTGQAGVTPGVHDALVGSRVGSQLLVVVAPADSYADGAWPPGSAAGDTLIYVIDVLGIQTFEK